MKVIANYLPFDILQEEKMSAIIFEQLKPLFKNERLIKRVQDIRGKFKLPASGIKKFLGVTDKVTSLEEKRNKQKFENWMSLKFTDSELKSMRIKIKSNKEQYLKEVKALRQEFDLPSRYDNLFATMLIPFGKFPNSVGEHLAKCLVRVYKDNGENRIFIEIFGDTTKADVEKAWDLAELNNLKKRFKLKGGQFFRHKNYYEAMLYKNGQELLDEFNEPTRDYAHKNIIQYRMRQKQAKNSK